MLWKIAMSLMALLSHSGDNRQGPPMPQIPNGDLEPPMPQIPNGDLTDVPEREFTPFEDGPQTPEEEAAAQKALHGDKFGGDMVWPDNFNQSGDGLRNEWYRWPGYPGGAVVPFVIDNSLGNIRPLIYRAMQAYHDNTCIRFVERTNQRDYVHLYYGDGCWSIIGRNGGRQLLSLGDGCAWYGLIIHELGHAIGLIHEHQRSDRNNYIWVYQQNVVQGQLSNFNLVDAANEIKTQQYDYNSIMHYGNYAFSRAPNQLMTMEAKNGQQLIEPYNKRGFTQLDLWNIRNLYRC